MVIAMQASTAEMEEAMRKDFESLPPELKIEMLDALPKIGGQSRGWWERILCGFEVPDAPPEEGV